MKRPKLRLCPPDEGDELTHLLTEGCSSVADALALAVYLRNTRAWVNNLGAGEIGEEGPNASNLRKLTDFADQGLHLVGQPDEE